jgi:hypothetical protein
MGKDQSRKTTTRGEDMSDAYGHAIAKMKRFAEGESTKILCGALKILKAQPKLDQVELMTQSVLMDVLCARYPHADAAVEKAFDEAFRTEEKTETHVSVDRVGVLLDAIQ